jgi:RHS repeat-associated protein
LATIDQKLYNSAATGTAITRYVHPDHLGSTNVVTDASGTVAQIVDYYPYGATRVSSTTYPTNEKRQYIGQFMDAQTGLDYLNARYYEAPRGQFLSQDPMFWILRANLQNPQSSNPYSYAENNPIIKKDTNGQFAVLALMAAGAVVSMVSQGVSDYASGNPVQWQNYAGAAAGGSVAPLAFLATAALGAPAAAPFVAGGIQNSTQELISQSLQISYGDQAQYDWTSVALNGGIGVAESGLPLPRIRSVSVGSNSALAVSNQMYTKIAKSQITNMSVRTVGKVAAANAVSNIAPTAIQTYINSASLAVNSGSMGGNASPQSRLWCTPNGAIINWGGLVVVPSPTATAASKK